MKKRQQKQSHEEFDHEEKSSWETPEFVKDIFTDFVDNAKESFGVDLEEEVEDEIAFDYLDETKIDEKDTNESEPSMEDMQFQHSDLSTMDEDADISTIKHRDIKKKIVHSRFFNQKNDLITAMIYKEILGKPRSLQRSIR